MTLKLRNTGIGGVEIRYNDIHLFIDAFNKFTTPPKIGRSDILLFTHDDNDHFDPRYLPDLKSTNIPIIGPPSLTYHLLKHDKVDLDQIQIMYSNKNSEAVEKNIQNVKIIAFNTEHFVKWKSVHNSYLLEFGDKTVYFTGDSNLDSSFANIIPKVDIIVCSLVDFNYIKNIEDKRFAVYHHMSYLLKIKSLYNPAKIIAIHLNDADWTVEAFDMKRLVEFSGVEGIEVPLSAEEYIDLSDN